jgi:hypothetical protein
MERKRYLELCQKVAVGNNLVVLYDGTKYKPKSLLISFNDNGECQNSAILQDLKCTSTRQVLLERVVENER